MTNAWQKAERLEKESLATKESITKRFQKKGRYWDYVESREWYHNHEWSLLRSNFQRTLRKYLGKPFSLFHKHIISSETYRYNGMAREYYSKWLLELGRYDSDVSAGWYHDYYTNGEGLVVYKYVSKEARFSRPASSKPTYPNVDCEFKKHGYPILYKNGIHYTKSFTYRKRISHSKLEKYDPITGLPIWRSWVTLEPVWQQMSSKLLKELSLINRLS